MLQSQTAMPHLTHNKRAEARRSWSSDERMTGSSIYRTASSSNSSSISSSSNNNSSTKSSSKGSRSSLRIWSRIRKKASVLHMSSTNLASHSSDQQVPSASSPASSAPSTPVSTKSSLTSLRARTSSIPNEKPPASIASSGPPEELRPANNRGVEFNYIATAENTRRSNVSAANEFPKNAAHPTRPFHSVPRSRFPTISNDDSKMRGRSFDIAGSRPIRPMTAGAVPEQQMHTMSSLRVSTDSYSPSTSTTLHSHTLQPRGFSRNASLGPDDVTADSIRRTLGAYTGRTETKSRPLLSRIGLLSRSNGTNGATNGHHRSSSRELSEITPPLASITEDDEAMFCNDQKASSEFTGNLGPPVPVTGERIRKSMSSQRSQLTNMSSGSMSRSNSRTSVDGKSRVHPSKAKRFSEHSGSTVSSGASGDTLDTSASVPYYTASENSDITFKVLLGEQTLSQLQATDKPIRVMTDPTIQKKQNLIPIIIPSPIQAAAWSDGYNRTPSPTTADPPALLPAVHGHIASKALSKALQEMDPIVYRNTFFNARTVEDQKRVNGMIKPRAYYNDNGLRRCSSDDTLSIRKVSNEQSDTLKLEPTKVRFNPDCDIIEPAPTSFILDSPVLSPSLYADDVVVLKPYELCERSLYSPTQDTRVDTKVPQVQPKPHPKPQKSDVSPKANVDITSMQRVIDSLQNENALLHELVTKDADCNSLSRDFVLRLRTVELENAWLRKELNQLKSRMGKIVATN